nr:aminodeoxychorismate synthase component I [uncultured Cohaesibacter sp.]
MAERSRKENPAPLFREVPFHNPAELLASLQGQDYLALLDSAARSPRLGRYSYLAFAPFAVFRSSGGIAYWNDTRLDDPPFVALNRKLGEYRLATTIATSKENQFPPFQGGALGYLSYEAGRLLEKLPQTTRDGEMGADILLPFYDLVLAVDHFAGFGNAPAAPRANDTASPRAFVFSSGWPHEGKDRELHAEKRLDWFCDKLAEASKNISPHHSIPSPISGWQSDKPRAVFEQSIEKTRDHIRQGDIFQANITQRFSARMPDAPNASPLDYYHALRAHNAAPFAAYLAFADHVIASSSPERFITLDADDHVETRPIKGTAPRDLADPQKDKMLARQLMQSEKDRAENIMITDLMRNDLSRVCETGSIRVPQLCALESYARVHHLVSVITGRLKIPHGAVALLAASFPGGSITGAPKIRAMEIISALEDLPRGVYCGSIGYLGFDGAMDTNIAIRTVTFKAGMAHFNVGGGITILSDPAAEYEECLHKASALFKAFGTSLEAERAMLEQRPMRQDRGPS